MFSSLRLEIQFHQIVGRARRFSECWYSQLGKNGLLLWILQQSEFSATLVAKLASYKFLLISSPFSSIPPNSVRDVYSIFKPHQSTPYLEYEPDHDIEQVSLLHNADNNMYLLLEEPPVHSGFGRLIRELVGRALAISLRPFPGQYIPLWRHQLDHNKDQTCHAASRKGIKSLVIPEGEPQQIEGQRKCFLPWSMALQHEVLVRPVNTRITPYHL